MVNYNSILDLVNVAESENEPVTLSEAKDFCKIDIGTDDDLLIALITTARQMCEAYTGVGFIWHDLDIIVNNTNGGIYLPYGPLLEIYSVTDNNGEVLILDTNYTISGGAWVRLESPKENNIIVSYSTGYDDDQLPSALKTGLLNAIYYLYDNRAQGVDNIGPIAKLILNPYKRV
ncbi:Phage conserved hypothetical protein [uncultured Caudovirales phage]|uniref:Gp6 domain containing protein n=1 Tax=uncultured Caudovirales phage TaxID=2100421 RepID=A0A6J7WP17_9CAUD|nr:Phage conserved hypothetical protein [uncultured Caudovirales phage]